MGHQQARDGSSRSISAGRSLLVPPGEPRGGATIPLGGPSRAVLARGRGRRSAFGRTTLRRVESVTDGARVVCRPATVGERPYLEHPHGAVERDRHDIARPHRLARRVDALAVDPHVTGTGERGSRRARPHHPRVPEPFIDALAVQGSTLSNAPSRTARGRSPAKRELVRRGGASTPSPSGAPWRSPRVAPSAPQAWRTGNSDRVRDRGGPCPRPAP
jgi:hypothetical protein